MELNILKQKNQDAVLSTDTAKQMLSNIFEACEYEANRVPMDVLQSYSHYRRERHGLQQFIVVLVIIAFMLLPLLFVTADLSLEWLPGAEPGKPVMQLTVDSFLPVYSIQATMNDREIDLYHEADGTYRIYPDQNGILRVRVTLENRQYTEEEVSVTTVDKESPKLVSSHLQNGELVVYLSDDSGTLDYTGIYAMDTQGEIYYPSSWNEAEMSVVFSYPSQNMNIFAPDLCGNVLQMVLNIE